MVWPCEAPAGYGLCATVLPVFTDAPMCYCCCTLSDLVFVDDVDPPELVDPLIFLVFELEFEPLGVFLTINVDFVLRPVWIVWPWPLVSVLR